MENLDQITLDDILSAQSAIIRFARRTPLATLGDTPLPTDEGIQLKLENLQRTGSFKIRGAANRLTRLAEKERKRGVITVSSGNHGRAISYVAGKLGIPATVCVTEHVPPHKVKAIERLGAEVVIGGEDQDQAERTVLELIEQRGLTFVHPFDDPHVIAGQGTIGLELLEDVPDLDTIIVPTSGGGLIGGIALAVKLSGQNARVLGVTMDRGAAMYESIKAGKLVAVEEVESIADALMGGIGLENRYTLRLCQTYVDEVVLVSEEEIKDAMAYLMREHRLVVEGGGAVGMAAILSQKVQLGERTAVVISGGNVDLGLLGSLLHEYSGN